MLPFLKSVPVQNYLAVDKFRGINVTEGISPGEYVSCSNVDSLAFPAISSRKKRSLFSLCNGTINGVGSFDGFFYTYYTETPKSIKLFFKGKSYEYKSYSDSTDYTTRRQFATLENCIVIIPDNVIFYTDTLKFKKINVNQVYKSGDIAKKFAAEGLTTANYDYTTLAKRGYITSSSIYSHVCKYSYTGYARDFYCIAFNKDLKAGDVIKVKATVVSPSAEYTSAYTSFVEKIKTQGFSAKIKSITSITHFTPKGTITEVTALNFDSNAINTGGYYDLHFTDITIERLMPDVSHICSFNNRIWAVGGGKVYASKLGEPDAWNDFSVDSHGTLPSSSFASSAATNGDFTAIIPHGNYIYALKENHIHKIYGDTPDEYTISNMTASGCLKGAPTIAVCGIYLVYASNNGICILREGYPKVISKKIGDISPICAAAQGNMYYVLCKHKNGRAIYVYDMDHDMWTMQSCGQNADNLCTNGSDVCFSEGEKLIYLTSDKGEEHEKNVHWNFRLRFDRNEFAQNTAIRLVARISLGKNASYTAYAIYDDDTRGAVVGECFDETESGSSILRLPVKRDLGFCIEFRGVGEFTMKSIKFSYYKSE